jgi:hypothetical protein
MLSSRLVSVSPTVASQNLGKLQLSETPTVKEEIRRHSFQTMLGSTHIQTTY